MGDHSTVRAATTDSLYLPFLVAAALLIGGGLFSAMFWLVTLQWVWFAGIGLLVLGALMLFSRRAGADRAV